MVDVVPVLWSVFEQNSERQTVGPLLENVSLADDTASRPFLLLVNEE